MVLSSMTMGIKRCPSPLMDAMRKIFKDNASEKSEQIDEIHNFSVVFYSEPVISR